MKIHFGLGGKKLPGWRNWGKDCDLKRALPYSDNIVTHLFVENGIEYLTHQEVFKFLEECHRILVPNGFIRIAIADISEQWSAMTPKIKKHLLAEGKADGSAKSTIKATVFKEGYRSCWNSNLLVTFLTANGFKTNLSTAGNSYLPEFDGLESNTENEIEPSIVEGVKI